MFSNSIIKFSKQPNKSLIFWILLFSFSCFTVFAMGREGISIVTYSIWLYITLSIIRKLSTKLFLSYLACIFIVSACYLPTSIYYGEINLGSVVSFYETDMAESREYIKHLGIKNFSYLLCYLINFVLLCIFNKSISTSLNHTKISALFIGLVIIPIIIDPVRVAIKQDKLSLDIIENVKYYPLRFVSQFFLYSKEYFQTKAKRQASLQQKSTWKVTGINQPYKNYVLVIGESMRKDYMSAYGYPIDTTPFLANTKGTVFNNFISASHNTNMSLQRMLFQNSSYTDTVYANTIVTLANSADMKTYWLSNQGQYGHYDVLASAISVKADGVAFLKKADYQSTKESDFKLLVEVDKILSSPEINNNRLIILHLMGSHSDFCSRLDDNYPIEKIDNFVNKDMSCYLSTLRQTDKLLQQLYHKLEESQQPFSVMYLSDHGLAHKGDDKKDVTLLHSSRYKQNFEAPLIVMSSDDNKKTYINESRSGFYLMTGLAEWLGIQEISLTREVKFFSNQADSDSIKIFNGETLVEFNTLQDDPPILPYR